MYQHGLEVHLPEEGPILPLDVASERLAQQR